MKYLMLVVVTSLMIFSAGCNESAPDAPKTTPEPTAISPEKKDVPAPKKKAPACKPTRKGGG